MDFIIECIPEEIRRRAGKYLINRYIGSFLEEGSGILLDQLQFTKDIHLFDVNLNISRINEVIADYNLPFPIEAIDGQIDHLSLFLPWGSLLRDSCTLSAKGLNITLQISRPEHAFSASAASISASIFHSMYESFSAVDMAEECLKQPGVLSNEDSPSDGSQSISDSLGANQSTPGLEHGVQLLAQTIESIFKRARFKLENINLRIEFCPTVQPRGLAVEFHMGRINYKGEADEGPSVHIAPSSENSKEVNDERSKKKLFFEDFSVHTDQFTYKVIERSMYNRSPRKPDARDSVGSEKDLESESETETLDLAEPPLELIHFAGVQELVLKIQETNEFGLPKKIEEIELNLQRPKCHAYPHQLHTLMEIINAFTVPSSDAKGLSPMLQKSPCYNETQQKMEDFLQRSMMQSTYGGLPGNDSNITKTDHSQWTRDDDSMASSSEFHSMSGTFKDDNNAGACSKPTPVPRMVVNLNNVAIALMEKDELFSKLGGEPSHATAMTVMQAASFNFFEAELEPLRQTDSAEKRIDILLKHIYKNCQGRSYIAIAATSICIIYDECCDANKVADKMVSVNVGKLVVKEVINVGGSADQPEIIDIIRFDARLMSKLSSATTPVETPVKSPPKGVRFHSKGPATDSVQQHSSVVNSSDLIITYREHLRDQKKDIDVKLNPCTIDFEPGFVDRIYPLLNYSELDPNCVKAPSCLSEPNEMPESPIVEVSVSCPRLVMEFHVPKADIRHPREIGGYVKAFWSRRIHPEVFELVLQDLQVKVNHCGIREPLTVEATTSNVEVAFQANQDAEKIILIKVKKSEENLAFKDKFASIVRVSVNLDDDQKLQGRYSSSDSRYRPPTERHRNVYKDASLGTYYVSQFGEVTGGNDDSDKSNIFIQQCKHIGEALAYGRTHNNLYLDLYFDHVSVVLPKKHVYEVIYNRLGNDMLLWVPEILRVKEFLYEHEFPDPLEDPEKGFEVCRSGLKPMLHQIEDSEASSDPLPKLNNSSGQNKGYGSFPRSTSSSLEIHTDTCVSLSLNKIQATISTAPDLCDESAQKRTKILMVIAENLKLTSVVGLEKDPEIVLFNLLLGKGQIKFGTWNYNLENIHFNESPSPNMQVLLDRTKFDDRAWTEDHSSRKPKGQLSLTAKVLFNSKLNLKSINLAFSFSEIGMFLSTIHSMPEWVLWLQDFFTVVEYPVSGYSPPALLTEMQFDIFRITLSLMPKAAAPTCLTLALGRAKIGMNLLDTGVDMGISVRLEDFGIFMSRDSVDPVGNSVCILAANLLTLEYQHRVGTDEHQEDVDDIWLEGDLVTIRTCADTILMLMRFIEAVSGEQPAVSPRHKNQVEAVTCTSRPTSPLYSHHEESETIVPDLEDAMNELVLGEKKEQALREEAERRSESRKQENDSNMFYFPDEEQGRSSNKDMPVSMTNSYYPGRSNPLDDPFMTDSLEEFSVLDEAGGSGVLSQKNETFSVQQNCPNESKVFLKTPYESLPDPDGSATDSCPGSAFGLRVNLSGISLLWQIYGGYDFQPEKNRSRSSSSYMANPRQLMPLDTTARTQSGSGQSTGSSKELKKDLKTRGGPGRDESLLLEVFVRKLSISHMELISSENNMVTCVLNICIPYIEIRDKLKNSSINKMMHLYTTRRAPRREECAMLEINVIRSRSHPNDMMDEYTIMVHALPIRINIDQDTMFFLIDFAQKLLPSPANENLTLEERSNEQRLMYNRGMKAVELLDEDSIAESARQEAISQERERDACHSLPRAQSQKLKSFIREFEFREDLVIRIDYNAKYVDLSQGPIAGILGGITSFNGSELTLCRRHYTGGFQGFERLLSQLIDDWLADIRTNQIPNIIVGIGPMSSVAQMVQGIKDLILIPIEQYQKDGRIFRGLQRGADSFTSSTAISLIDITNKMFYGLRIAAELAFKFMKPPLPIGLRELHPDYDSTGNLIAHTRRPSSMNRPSDLREGVMNAIAVVREGFDDTARSLANTIAHEHARGGVPGALGGILLQVPSTILTPVIVASAATSNVLEGVQGSVAPELRKEEEDKWRTSPYAKK